MSKKRGWLDTDGFVAGEVTRRKFHNKKVKGKRKYRPDDVISVDISSSKAKKIKGGFIRCFESHPALTLKGDLVIYGGSCSSPMVSDADVYIGFDNLMARTDRRFPWHSGTEVFFKILDGSTPDSLKDFRDLVYWTAAQIESGKKVHAGCVGGHGRTGLFLAALVSVMMGEKNAIQYVRKHYCSSAVETTTQLKWLHKNFGIEIKGLKGSRGGGWSKSSGTTTVGTWGNDNEPPYYTGGLEKELGSSSRTTGRPIGAKGNIWGAK